MSKIDKFHQLIIDKHPDDLLKNYLAIDITDIKYTDDISVLFNCGYTFEIRESKQFLILVSEWNRVKRNIKMQQIIK